jgi:hypothetical protein
MDTMIVSISDDIKLCYIADINKLSIFKQDKKVYTLDLPEDYTVKKFTQYINGLIKKSKPKIKHRRIKYTKFKRNFKRLN